MSRKNTSIKKHPVEPDPIYNNRLLSQFINRVMRSGKKTTAQKQVYNALTIIGKEHENPLEVFQIAMKNVAPQMEVRSRRIGGAAYQVPTPVRGNRKTSLAIRWILGEAKARSNKDFHTFAEKLAAEILDAFKEEGGAIKKKETAHKMADANRAFSHFKW